jgi:hypothetical protein
VTGWQPVGTSGLFQFARVDLSTGDFTPVGNCNNGVHTIVGSFPSNDGGDASAGAPFFGVTIWGWGNPITDPNPDDVKNPNDIKYEADPSFTRWVSYGYPAGANILKLNNVIVPTN